MLKYTQRITQSITAVPQYGDGESLTQSINQSTNINQTQGAIGSRYLEENDVAYVLVYTLVRGRYGSKVTPCASQRTK